MIVIRTYNKANSTLDKYVCTLDNAPQQVKALYNELKRKNRIIEHNHQKRTWYDVVTMTVCEIDDNHHYLVSKVSQVYFPALDPVTPEQIHIMKPTKLDCGKAFIEQGHKEYIATSLLHKYN